MKDYSKKHLPAGLKKFLLAAAAFLLAALFVMSAANLLVVSLSAKYIIPFESAVSRGADSIVVLGAGVRANGTLTDILRDRVDTAAALYFAGAAERIIVSGEHNDGGYSEPEAMKAYLIGAGVPESAIITDPRGNNTYKTAYRASHVYGAERPIFVTQDFHMARTVYLARAAGADAVGVTADKGRYVREKWYEIREFIARSKYFFDGIFLPDGE